MKYKILIKHLIKSTFFIKKINSKINAYFRFNFFKINKNRVRLSQDNNEQLIENNQPLEANNNNCDNWPKMITLSLLPFFLFVPYFEILKTNSEQQICKKIFYIQGFFGFISSIGLIVCICYMFGYSIDSVQKGWFRC